VKLKSLHLLPLLITVFCWNLSVSAQTCPTTPPSKQARATVKKKKPADDIAVSNITVSDLFDWDVPSDIADPKVRKSKKPIDPHEEEAFTLTGDLWRVARMREKASNIKTGRESNSPMGAQRGVQTKLVNANLASLLQTV
jgi:hypothetical protein